MFSYFKTEYGADIVVHSVTKYINGHSDVVMGVVCTNNENIYKQLRFIQNGVGAVPSPFDCYLAHRGLKTLHLRMEASARLVGNYIIRIITFLYCVLFLINLTYTSHQAMLMQLLCF